MKEKTMLTSNERKELRIHYVNRFRNQNTEGRLPVDQTDTKEYKRLDRTIKNLEAELQDARHELYELNNAFDTVSHEETVRKNKAKLGVRDEIDAILKEVYERTQQSSKLRGENLSWRHSLPSAYAAVVQYVNHGKYGKSYDRDREFDPLFIEYQLMDAAGRITWHDNTKKGQPLYNRVNSIRNDAWNRWNAADRPVDKQGEDNA
jgi:uncharacterized protein YdcH (DUF465 family)